LLEEFPFAASFPTVSLSSDTARSPLATAEGRIGFALRQPFELARSVYVEFDGAELRATGEGLFTDYWEKVLWRSMRRYRSTG
jgi:hypothetical protein